jgi:carbonic anhydrase
MRDFRRKPGVRPRFAIRPTLDALEARLALSTATPAAALPLLGTIQGQVVDQTTGLGVAHVKVQLINSHGRVAQSSFTDPSGSYAFDVSRTGPYVVREVTPRGYVQTEPTVATTAPAGALLPGYGNSSWNYTSSNAIPTYGTVGPNGWSNITSAGSEPFESPIDIHTRAINLSGLLSVDYAPAVPTHIINNGHQIQVQFPSTAVDSITAAGVQFNLAQFHYHDPAETTVHGRHYALEEHFVNTSASGGETVVAVFIKKGAYNAGFQPVLNAALNHLFSANTTTTISTPIDFASLLPASPMGWFYEGSLTTPPLSQPVNWFVLQQPITLDANQIAEYEQVAGNSGFLPNARPVQPADGRQLNQFNQNVNFQGGSVSGVDFGVTPLGT